MSNNNLTGQKKGNQIIKTIKGMDKDMRCRGFQYEQGKAYTMEGPVKACSRGFHACERPLDVFDYYPPASSRYFETEQFGEISRDGNDSKIASSKIRIGAEIGIPGLVRAHIEYVRAHTTEEHTDPKMATAGYKGAATSRGSSAVGVNGIACARGNGCRVKGGLGAVLVIAEEKRDSYDLDTWKAVVVDGETIKADTWYKLVNGELVEDEIEGDKA